jgi:hypothetical protein
MDEQHQNPSPSDGSDQPADSARSGVSRRALLRSGAGASPILLTLASGPVAATTNCQVASSFVSATVYKSRNPTANNIKCVTKTALTHCNEAKTYSRTGCNWNPHLQDVSAFVSGTISCSNGTATAFTGSTKCYHVFKNSWSTAANTGTGLQSTGDVAVLQRLLALGFGAGAIFTASYCQQIWAARNTPSMLAALVNDSGNTWDSTRLMAWLDYSANGITF